MISLSVLAASACGAAGGGPGSSAPASVSGSGFSGQLAQPGTLAVGVAAIYPPYAFLEGGSKTPVGFEIDITNAVAAKLGLKPSYASVEFASLVSGIQSKRFDVATTGIGDTTVREGQVDFVDYEQTYPALLVAKKLEGQIKGLEGMCGRSGRRAEGQLTGNVDARASDKMPAAGQA